MVHLYFKLIWSIIFQALITSMTPGDTEDIVVEQRQMIGQFNKSLMKIDKKEKVKYILNYSETCLNRTSLDQLFCLE